MKKTIINVQLIHVDVNASLVNVCHHNLIGSRAKKKPSAAVMLLLVAPMVMATSTVV